MTKSLLTRGLKKNKEMTMMDWYRYPIPLEDSSICNYTSLEISNKCISFDLGDHNQNPQNHSKVTDIIL